MIAEPGFASFLPKLRLEEEIGAIEHWKFHAQYGKIHKVRPPAKSERGRNPIFSIQ
jgi:hypothetical protein